MTRTSIAAILASLVLASSAHAADANRIAVSVRDLDLGTSAGRAELSSRIHAAAATLCGPALRRDNPGSEESIREHRIIYAACIGRLSERAVAGIKTGRD